ncbi:hypothetical protein [Metaplanococcus flavidus]|uniref:Lipoprotein n=1 Tax=Metaplanococcus flavidus TaxID=569883 RepID=A0ABW3LI65_9BACL
MNLKKLITLLIMVLILSGCVDGDRYNFSGSSENWDVVYVVDVRNWDEQNDTGTIKYIGEKQAPETLDYKIEFTAGSDSGTGKTLDNGVTQTGGGGCQGCAVIQKDEEIEVEITWNGQTENLILTTGK